MMDSEKRLGSEELVDTMRQCGNIALGCGECQFKIYRGHDAGCIRSLMTAAAGRLEEYVDRCARFSEEIMVLREQRKKVEQPGGCAFAPWCDAVREAREKAGEGQG